MTTSPAKAGLFLYPAYPTYLAPLEAEARSPPKQAGGIDDRVKQIKR